jgi:hypothetical protein
MTQFTLNLPDRIARQVMRLAALRGQAAEEYLAGIVGDEVSADTSEEDAFLATLSDEEVLALADLRMAEDEDRRMHELLDKNSEGTMTSQDRAELDELMVAYSEGTLKKAMGWAEAVRRKLREPIEP